ncbi:hypothetical protein [Flavobacterium hungaricum]|uniref:DUF3592 domain-containing protein n=1 Tax=Flavobacterium hungaricum TaxID=2082725 RepID=A0ABR9TF47_9FLAO|nr:hypothetical protein [Flavobacterium hungaricum]MBE8723976.1 hypothetical protein [Flavobacterium hungaricum]
MGTNHQTQIKQLKKIFLGPFLFILIILLLFISFHLVKSEYNEYFKYGQISKGIVNNTYFESSGDSPPTSLFYCNIKTGTQNYTFEIQNADQSFVLSAEEIRLIEEIKKNDTVTIKIVNDKEAKILEWKNLQINPVNKFWDIFGIWLVILVQAAIAGFLMYKMYILYKK